MVDLFELTARQPAPAANDAGNELNQPDLNDGTESSNQETETSWITAAAQDIWSGPETEMFDASPASAVQAEGLQTAQDRANDEDMPWAITTGEQPDRNAQQDEAPRPAGDGRPAQPEDGARLALSPADGRDLGKSIQWLERTVELADRTDTKQALQRISAGQTAGIDLIEVLMQPGLTADRRRILQDMAVRVHAEKWSDYERYLDPALARANLALARISSGDDKQILEGEKGLIAAVAMRPELQFNSAFQTSVLTAYQQMENGRKARGLPRWTGELKPETAATGTANDVGAAADDAIGKANEAYAGKGIKDAIPHFNAAIEAADKMPHDKLAKELTELFCLRLTIEREIIGKELRSENVQPLLADREKAKEAEWGKYSEYLKPGSMRVNAALAMISSGDSEMLSRGKTLLSEAISKRPELEFDADYQEYLQKAFESHYRNKPAQAAAPAEQPGEGQNNDPFRVGYKPIETKDLGKGSTDLETDTELSSYVVDSITGPVLTAAVIYLGYRVVRGRIERVRARRAAATAAQAEGRTTEVKPGETKPAENRPENTRPAEVKPETLRPEGRPAEPKPGTPEARPEAPRPETPRPETPRPETPRPETPRAETARPEAPRNTTGVGAVDGEIRIETTPFESGGQGEPRVERPAAAMEAGKFVEIRLPGNVVARMLKAEAPAFLDRLEKEFKTDEFGKVIDELIKDKTRTEEERRQLTELKERFEKLPPEMKQEAKTEFFRNARAQAGIEIETKESDRARSGRVGRALAVGGGALGVGILSAAVLRYCMQKQASNTYNRVNVEFIKK